ncbi:MAG: putative lipid II flippase FtsW [Tetrasphaera sp.]|nr:putative lipid II flippase FtsW [Tetrasphaera sp.]
MSSATAPAARRRESLTDRMHTWFARFDSPVTTYYLILSVTGFLVIFGLIMVWSASTVVSLQETGSVSPFAIVKSQLFYAVIGGAVLYLASRVSVLWWKRLALPILGVSLIAQLLVFTTLFGDGEGGNRAWLVLGPISGQPSEGIKIALALTGALILTRKRPYLGRVGHVVVPYLVPIAALSMGLVVLGNDLGTTLVLAAIVAAVLFAAGVPVRWFVGAIAAFGVVATAYIVNNSNRLGRFDVWLGRNTDIDGAARQPIHGRYALADGGWLGVGLGASREKWGLLSEPHNDFIFAIIGEELGLPGTLAVLALFAGLVWGCLRLALRTEDFFVRVATAGIMAWILFQALVNIGAVIQLAPVVGLPLPLISSGGSSLVTTLFALGILLSFARSEPGCAQRLSATTSVLRRSVAVIPAVARRGRR